MSVASLWKNVEPEMTPLRNAQHEEFAQLYADGDGPGTAYMVAYGSDRDEETGPMCHRQATKRGSDLLNRRDVVGRIKGIKQELADRALWTREDSVRVLAEVAVRKTRRDPDGRVLTIEAKDSDRIAAVKELNAMHGFSGKFVIDHLSSDGSQGPMSLADFYAGAKGLTLEHAGDDDE